LFQRTGIGGSNGNWIGVGSVQSVSLIFYIQSARYAMRFATGEDKENHHQNEHKSGALNIREANAAAAEDCGQCDCDQEDRKTHSNSMGR